LPTLRLTISGTRVVVMSRVGHASRILDVDMKKPQAFARLSQAMLSATQAKVTALGDVLLHVTVNPGDTLFTPAGWVVCESSGIGGGPRASNKDARGSVPMAAASSKTVAGGNSGWQHGW